MTETVTETVSDDDMDELKRLVCEHLDELVRQGIITHEGLRGLLKSEALRKRFLETFDTDVVRWFMHPDHTAAVEAGVDGILRRTATL